MHGANGILFWGTAYIERDSELRSDMEAVVGELARWERYLASPRQPALKLQVERNANSDEASVLARAWEQDGTLLVLVVNESPGAIAFEVSGIEHFGSHLLRAVDVIGEETVPIAGGRFRFGLGGSATALLTTEPERRD